MSDEAQHTTLGEMFDAWRKEDEQQPESEPLEVQHVEFRESDDMGTWSIRGVDSELKFRENDDFISILCHPDNVDDAWAATMTYQEFMELANWLGFDIQPRGYLRGLKRLSDKQD